MGVCYTSGAFGKGVNTLFMEEDRLTVVRHSERSNTVLLTQSGGIAITSIDKFSRSPILRSVVSFGNKYDVKVSDLTAYFCEEKDIELIAVYLEGLDTGEGRQFFDICKKAAKPVVVYKAGKTEAGAKAAASHTASISGSYDVFKAACRQAGAILAEDVEDLYGYIQAFSLLSERRLVGGKVAGVVNSGFESTAGADELCFLKQAQLLPLTVDKIKQTDTHGLVDVNSSILDITAMSDDRMYASFVEAVLQDDNTDCVFVSVIPHVSQLKTIPGNCHDLDGLANLLIELFHKYTKPMVVSVNAGEYYQEFISLMQKGGLPVYTDIRTAVRSLDTFAEYKAKQILSQEE